METLWQDIRYGFRTLAKKPGFAAVAVLTLALGIGANTAIFSVINTVMLTPPPYNDPDTIVRISTFRSETPRGPVLMPTLATDTFQDWREQTESLAEMAVYMPQQYTLTDREEPLRLTAARVSPALFPLLRVAPIHGRAFTPEEEKPGNGRVALLSYSGWEKRFGSDPDIVGGTMELEGNPYQVIGILPEHFYFPDKETEFWVPYTLSPPNRDPERAHIIALPTLARLQPGVTVEQAETEGNVILRRLEEIDPEVIGAEIQMVTLQEQMVAPIRPALLLLMAAVGFVLLIACANVANLLLMRAAARQREFAIRASIGAGAGRLARQVLTESVVLSLLGGASGLVLAWWGLQLILGLSPDNIPRLEEAGVDFHVLLFTLGLSLVTGVAFGLVPALRISRANLMQSLKDSTAQSSSGLRLFRHNKTKSFLAVGEIALALMLLTGAGLLLNSFARLTGQDPGYNPKGVVAMQVSIPRARYPQDETQLAFYNLLLEKTRKVPGVQKAGLVNFLPMAGRRTNFGFRITGQPVPTNQEETPSASLRFISPEYFSTMGIPLIYGRDFSEDHRVNAPSVVIVNQTLAQQYFAGENPVGQRLQLFNPEPVEIVGVAGGVKSQGLDSEPEAILYLPYQQNGWVLLMMGARNGMQLVVRTGGEPASIVPRVRSLLSSIDPMVPLSNVITLEQRLSNSVAQPRFYSMLLSLFAGLALALAAVGIYGMLAYHVSQNTQEIGIRMALGAGRGEVLKMVLQQGMILTLLGIGLGLAGAWAAARFLSSMLFGITSTDPVTYLGVSFLLMMVALLACYIPARRATQVDPMVALRYE